MGSAQKFELDAHVRHEIGKGASRRLRREEKLPGVIYGGGKGPVALTFEHKQVIKALQNESFYSHIITLKTNGEAERVILKDLQRHAFKPRILHIDFQRVRSDEKLTMSIPLHFEGADLAPGAIEAGGVISHIASSVEISCFPDDLPEYLSIDISQMQLNDILHLSDIKLPKGVEIVALAHEDNKPIVSIHMPHIQEEEPEPTEAPEASEVPATAQKSDGEEAQGEEQSDGDKKSKS
ncbi:MAG TPA: 50S ribosomal protein L25/general stress protein Ctc [Gammaproteobacteria bacterium]|jgi:large subunit ribosomal protein L25|nr:50S ribosomal protein L25/general stress protein Ctc [Gammaproteobacteria bacterium]